MRGFKVFVVAVVTATSLSAASSALAGSPVGDTLSSAAHGKGHGHRGDIVSFDVMYGVDGPFVAGNPVRGIIGDELPWTVANSATGNLDTSGHLRIKVRGLVFKDDPSVPADLRGINDESEFRGVVSCLTEGTSDTPVRNVFTHGFPATRSGDATIDAELELPNPCVAPIVMVLAGTEDKWFAIAGFESEGD